MENQPEFVRRYLAGEATPQDRADLEAWLLADDLRVREFSELLVTDELLRAHCGSDSEPASSLDPRRTRPHAVTHRGRAYAVLVLAATLLIAVTLLWRPPGEATVTNDDRRVGEPGAGGRPIDWPDAEARESIVAYLGRTSGCDWRGEPIVEGSQLPTGSSLALASGVAEVIFENGARVAVHGPCELEIDGPSTCSLRIGNASIHVPETAFGFKVATPSGIVIDLGTEFAVSVDSRGDSEVHVFKGEVAFQALTVSGAFHDKALRLTETQACKYSLGGNTLEEFEANEARFDWRNRTPIAASDLPPLPVREGLALWLAADLQVETDSDQRVERWRDLVSTDNRVAEDALQLNPNNRPRLVIDGMNGRPALRFDRPQSFLLTPPLNTGNEQTAIVIASVRKRHPAFQSLVNYNGPPQRVVGSLGARVKPGVFEICLRDRDDDGWFAVCGEVFGGYKDGAPKRYENLVRGFVEDLNALGVDGSPRVIAFRYSLDAGEMSLFVDGDLKGTSKTDMPIAIASRKIIGCHPVFEASNGSFHGDLGELMLYNRALTDVEVSDVSAYLADRFRIVDTL